MPNEDSTTPGAKGEEPRKKIEEVKEPPATPESPGAFVRRRMAEEEAKEKLKKEEGGSEA